MTHEYRRQAPPILTSASAALMLLQAAQSCEIPLPDQIEHIVHHDGEAELAFYVSNLDALAAWSTWLEEPIACAEQLMPSGRVHASIDGVMFDQKIRVICMFVPADEVVSA